MEWCEECEDYKRDAYRRPDAGGRVLCNHHYYEFLRRNSPTGYVRRPERLPAWMREAKR